MFNLTDEQMEGKGTMVFVAGEFGGVRDYIVISSELRDAAFQAFKRMEGDEMWDEDQGLTLWETIRHNDDGALQFFMVTQDSSPYEVAYGLSMIMSQGDESEKFQATVIVQNWNFVLAKELDLHPREGVDF